jgi:6-phosphogluconolactonase (cycloisomerase 2 family)
LGRIFSVPALALLLFSGCGKFFVADETTSTSTTSSSSSADYVYVMNEGSSGAGTIAGYSLSSGSLTAVTDSPYSVSYAPTVAYVRPGDDLLYVGSALSGGIYCYKIGSGGALSAENSGSAVASVLPVAMTIDPSGDFLAVLLDDYTTVIVYEIDTSTGTLTSVGSGTAQAGGTGAALLFTPNEDNLYVATGTGGLSIFTFDSSTGAITDTGGRIAAGSEISFNALATDSSSEYLLIARSGTNAGVDVHTITTNGALESGTIYSAQTGPWSLAFNSGSTDLYVANKGSSTVSEFSFSSGVLTLLTSTPASTASTPVAVAADSSGDYLLALSSGGTPNLTVFSFSSGVLESASTLSSTGTGPIAMAVTH